MTIAQITVLSVISILYLWSAFYRLYKYDNERNNTSFEIILFSFTMLLVFLMTIDLNKYRKNLKCPEYEKVENVYRLKK
jgi:hypothetical protein